MVQERTSPAHFRPSLSDLARRLAARFGEAQLAGFTRWMLIDGQQRLTTLTLLLAALRDHISEIKWAGGENDPTPNASTPIS
jgi:hypothetical protein